MMPERTIVIISHRLSGRYKAEWAEKIGDYLDLSNNKSPSFQRFNYELLARVYVA